jgi:hypothetical protein
VYFSDNFDDVNDGTGDAFRVNQVPTYVVVGLPDSPYPDGLILGTTYYWRVDEVNDTEPNSPWKGPVWSFTIEPIPVAYWKLDETEGMFAADSVGDNDAFVLGGSTWLPSGGQVDGALQLDGASGCAIASPVLDPADGSFSILAWVNGGAPGQVVVSQQAIANWLAVDTEGNLMTELKSSDQLAGPLLSETVITDGQWHRIGLVWDGSYRTLYVDGVSVAEDTQPGLEGSQMGLYIGVDKNYAPGTFFSGLIDDVRIYNRVVHP